MGHNLIRGCKLLGLLLIVVSPVCLFGILTFPPSWENCYTPINLDIGESKHKQPEWMASRMYLKADLVVQPETNPWKELFIHYPDEPLTTVSVCVADSSDTVEFYAQVGIIPFWFTHYDPSTAVDSQQPFWTQGFWTGIRIPKCSESSVDLSMDVYQPIWFTVIDKHHNPLNPFYELKFDYHRTC
jgi:hypothetical protein